MMVLPGPPPPPPLVVEPVGGGLRCGPPGWFSAIELGLVAPDLNYHLSGPVALKGGTTQVTVPAADLDWVGSPRFDLGYRFGDGLGALVGSYRNVTSQGSGNIDHFDPAGGAFIQSRLNMNVIDLDYVSTELAFAPEWDLTWQLGARLAFVYFDSRATGKIFDEASSDNFIGAGPHFGVAVRRNIDLVPGLAAFGSLDGAVVIGESSTHFQASEQLGGGAFTFNDNRISGGRSVPVLTFRTGLSYAPPASAPWFRFAFGYEFEQWWGLGNVGDSHADVNVQGLFFRGEFRY
jgi:hypothetical protein